MSDLVSIIVPVFNAEKYLDRCITGILNQSYHNIQLILIDDGSNDNSLEICKKYEQNDNRIKVIHQHNSGVSVARNEGIDAVKGTYFTFVDADDELSNNAIYTAVSWIQKYNADMVTYGWKRKYENNKLIEEIIPQFEYVDNNKKLIYGILENYSMYGGGYPWNKLWCRNSFCEEIPKFNSELYYFEDLEWVIKAATKIKKCVVCPEPLYIYSIRDDSVTNNKNQLEKRELGYHHSIKCIIDELSSYPDIQYWFSQKYYPEIVNGVIGAKRNRYFRLEKYLKDRYKERKGDIKVACKGSLKLMLRKLYISIIINKK